MAANRVELAPGLYFLATPIGSARDITLRALDILASADVLVAEDTRSLRKLMDIHGIALNGRKVLSYHDHSKDSDRRRILQALEQGCSVAYASEAGTPMVADPGFQLGNEAAEAGFTVTSAPGASAVLAALTNSGLGTDRFFFGGFPPTGKSARKSFLSDLQSIPGTLVFYESPKRIHGLLADMLEVFGSKRKAVVARELTKKFEEVLRGTISSLNAEIRDRNLKGEIVVLVDREASSGVQKVTDAELQGELLKAMETLSMKDAVHLVSSSHNLQRRHVYQLALDLKH